MDVLEQAVRRSHKKRANEIKKQGKLTRHLDIDQHFLKWLGDKIEGISLLPDNYATGGHSIVQPDARIILERFERVKHDFTGKEHNINITLPTDAVIKEQFRGDLESGTINIPTEAMAEMFEHSVAGTIKLIAKQVAQVRMKRKPNGAPYDVTVRNLLLKSSSKALAHYSQNIFLSGGFAESKYLFERVRDWAYSEGDIELQRASDR